MKLMSLDGYKQNMRFYGGSAGRKLGLTIDGEKFLIKYPGNLKEHNMKNIQLSYSNSPISEHIGSLIYKELGIPVHDTIMGSRDGKIVVACKDFVGDGEELIEFLRIKVSFIPSFTDSSGNQTNGAGSDLQEVLLTIEKHPAFEQIRNETIRRFWDMFVVDALIGNGDRNNGNWGIIINKNTNDIRLSPVYDNGNCLNNKWTDEKMLEVLDNKGLIKAEAYDARRCVFTLQGKAINPYHYISSQKDVNCNLAVKRLVPKIRKIDFDNLLSNVGFLSEAQIKFHIAMMEERISKVFAPTLNKILSRNNDIEI